jgi:hypothetical protein
LPSVITLDKLFTKYKISFAECLGHSTKKTSLIVVEMLVLQSLAKLYLHERR